MPGLLALHVREPFWQARYYDFNVRSPQKRFEKLRYIHSWAFERITIWAKCMAIFMLCLLIFL